MMVTALSDLCWYLHCRSKLRSFANFLAAASVATLFGWRRLTFYSTTLFPYLLRYIHIKYCLSFWMFLSFLSSLRIYIIFIPPTYTQQNFQHLFSHPYRVKPVNYNFGWRKTVFSNSILNDRCLYQAVCCYKASK